MNFKKKNRGLTSWQALLAFSRPAVTLVASLKNEKSQKESYKDHYKIEFDWFQKLTRALSIAMLIHFQTWGPIIGVGGEYNVDPWTSLKAKINAKWPKRPVHSQKIKFRLGLGIRQKITENIEVTLGADVNLRHVFGDMNNSGKEHTFGVECKIGN